MNLLAQIILGIGALVLVLGFCFGVISLGMWLEEHVGDPLATRPPRRYRKATSARHRR